jgi:hypothetical protein
MTLAAPPLGVPPALPSLLPGEPAATLAPHLVDVPLAAIAALHWVDQLGAVPRGRGGVRVCGWRRWRRRWVRPRWRRRGRRRRRQRVATWTVLSVRWHGADDLSIGAAARLIVHGHGQIVSATDQDQDQRRIPHCGELAADVPPRQTRASATPRSFATVTSRRAGRDLSIQHAWIARREPRGSRCNGVAIWLTATSLCRLV